MGRPVYKNEYIVKDYLEGLDYPSLAKKHGMEEYIVKRHIIAYLKKYNKENGTELDLASLRSVYALDHAIAELTKALHNASPEEAVKLSKRLNDTIKTREEIVRKTGESKPVRPLIEEKLELWNNMPSIGAKPYIDWEGLFICRLFMPDEDSFYFRVLKIEGKLLAKLHAHRIRIGNWTIRIGNFTAIYPTTGMIILPKKGTKPVIFWNCKEAEAYLEHTLELLTAMLYHFGYDVEVDERENGLYVFRKKEVDHAETKEE